ncbi:MAG TPA: hypothetical protein PKA13_01595 [Geminicoccaceae bacterium]|nr:hypothetical protein [Geminicoccus sp.]HMU48435.1 hypothetical protein [Geminicoccaceae bacterium]
MLLAVDRPLSCTRRRAGPPRRRARALLGGKGAVLIGLTLMISGELTMAHMPVWSMQIAGRLLAESGGILLNVAVARMIADWFVGREIGTAMAIFGNAAPVGIALALATLPAISVAAGRMAMRTPSSPIWLPRSRLLSSYIGRRQIWRWRNAGHRGRIGILS